MIETMWVWGALGLILLSAEMATGTFDILWFGIAALCVALIMWLFPSTSHAIQYTIFAVLSLTSLAIWRIYYKKTETHSSVGQSQGPEIGRIGTVIEACSPHQNGKIRFSQGLMGARVWTAVSNEEINVGTQATVIAVEGNALRINAV
ncbi:MAG TPA: NfeD family protein [Methylophilaceae bacterium]|nr:NfeD family protein [Methylophilaceae bacterium]